MEKRASILRHGWTAVAVSLALHAVVLLGFRLLPSRAIVEARTGHSARTVPFDLVEMDSGEVSFIARSEATTKKKSRKNSPSIEPYGPGPETAQLKNPWDPGDATTSVSPGNTGDNAEPSETGSHGGNGTTSFFEVAATGRRIVFVIDGSASMGKNGALKAACRELFESVKKLPPTAQFQIIVYNRTPQYLLGSRRNWLEPTLETLAAVGAALAEQVPEGRTEHGPALQEAFRLQPDVIFLLTDADDLSSEHLRQVQRLNQRHAVVNTIELNIKNRARGDMPLQVLARENGGRYQAVDLAR